MYFTKDIPKDFDIITDIDMIPNKFFGVFIQEDKIVAAGNIEFEEDSIYIHHLEVLKLLRGNNIGEQVVDYLSNYQNIKKLIGESTPFAIDFWIKQGFQLGSKNRNSGCTSVCKVLKKK